MSNREIKFFKNIKDFYDEIEYKNLKSRDIEIPLNSPFQYEIWQKLLYKEHTIIHPKTPYIGVLVMKNDIPILGGNFFLKLRGRRRGLFFLGSGGETDYHDLIYFSDSIKDEDIQFLVTSIAEKFSISSFSFLQIQKNSPLSEWTKSVGIDAYKTTECACINLCKSYNEYFKSLNKHVRQNIRTANNRTIKDNCKINFTIYEDQVIPEELKSKLLYLYENRRTIKNKKLKKSGFKYLVYEKIRIHRKKKYNIISEIMDSNYGTFLGIYKINNTIAAYCFGLKKKTGDISIMQVSINNIFEKYSPGMLLLSSIFHTLLDDGKNLLFDLTSGNEKYKFSLGAFSHFTDNFKFTYDKGKILNEGNINE